MTLFKTQKEVDAAIGNFRQLKGTAGWQLIVSMLRNDLEGLKRQIIDGGIDEDKLDRMRDAVRIYESVINAPDKWIQRLQDGNTTPDDSDPYFTVESLRESRRHSESRQDTQ